MNTIALIDKHLANNHININLVHSQPEERGSLDQTFMNSIGTLKKRSYHTNRVIQRIGLYENKILKEDNFN